MFHIHKYVTRRSHGRDKNSWTLLTGIENYGPSCSEAGEPTSVPNVGNITVW